MQPTTIEWVCRPNADGSLRPGYTYNPWIGCVKISPACDRCYAAAMAVRRNWRDADGRPTWGTATQGAGRKVTKTVTQLLRAHRKAVANGVRHTVFCASLADVFERFDGLDALRAALWSTIAATPLFDYMLLTKRPHNIAQMLPAAWRSGVPANVWLGTSVENQHYADQRIPQLLATPAPLHFLSCEPLLGPLDLARWLSPNVWVLLGGESGHGARPLELQHVRRVIADCRSAGAPVFVKELGTRWAKANGITGTGRSKGEELSTWPADLRIRDYPAVALPEGAPASHPSGPPRRVDP